MLIRVYLASMIFLLILSVYGKISHRRNERTALQIVALLPIVNTIFAFSLAIFVCAKLLEKILQRK